MGLARTGEMVGRKGFLRGCERRPYAFFFYTFPLEVSLRRTGNIGITRIFLKFFTGVLCDKDEVEH